MSFIHNGWYCNRKTILFSKKNRQQTLFYLPKNQINTIKNIHFPFLYFYSKKIRFHHEIIQSLLNFPVLFYGEAQLPLRTKFVKETYIKCKNYYFLLIFFQKKIISPPKTYMKKFFKNVSSNSQPGTKITSG